MWLMFAFLNITSQIKMIDQKSYYRHSFKQLNKSLLGNSFNKIFDNYKFISENCNQNWNITIDDKTDDESENESWTVKDKDCNNTSHNKSYHNIKILEAGTPNDKSNTKESSTTIMNTHLSHKMS